MEPILGTHNISKTLQIQTIFDGSPFILRTMDQAGIKGEAYEDGNTLLENATKKGRYIQEQAPGRIIITDDTGLFIDAYDGEPGVDTAYWAGRTATQDEITAFVIEKMRGIEDRRATWRTIALVIMPDGTEYSFEGSIAGTLLHELRCESQPGMPYSGLFVPDGYTKCWAEMTTEEENAISHRGIAFRAARDFLEKHLA